ncbi:hypothetical protein [Deinococcus fonticola]|uniref:hypothetical protein n=1 Tax=Deinococcus fonticola TaxID=2528713 RepID=UPI0010750CBD|nr:hypothetical protein [Deinococcus fonticola]
MSVIGFAADEIKSIEAAAREICGDHTGGDHWPAFYVSNHSEYAERYESRSLTDAERVQLRREYAAAPARQQYTPTAPADLMTRLQSLLYNCEEFSGDTETARRKLLDCVAFELMTEGGPAVNLDTFANVQRMDFNTYRMTTIDPREGARGRAYTFAKLQGQPHPYEGHTTTDPRELFRMVWEMRDDCAADYRAQDARRMAEFMALMESGHSYHSAQMEMLKRQLAAS